MNLLIVKESDFISPGMIRVEGRRSEHIKCVLRAKEGDLVRTGFLGGNTTFAKVVKSERAFAELAVESFDSPPPQKTDIIPIIALPRPQSFKKTLHFIASAGVPKTYFIGAEKVEKSYWKSSALEQSAIGEELMLGLEQGMDTIMPQLEFRTSFREFMKSTEPAELSAGATCLIAHPGTDSAECPRALSGKVVLAIGPEGGFTEKEASVFRDAGFSQVTFGKHILRVEFALAFICGRIS